jgi:hypothetical protein
MAKNWAACIEVSLWEPDLEAHRFRARNEPGGHARSRSPDDNQRMRVAVRAVQFGARQNAETANPG